MKAISHTCVFAMISIVIPHLLLCQESEWTERDDPAARENYEFQMLHSPHSGIIPGNIHAREIAFSSTLPVRQLLKSSDGEIQVQNWTHRGPDNVGGRTRALAIDVSNENNLLAGGVSGGMWRSIDGGQSWVRTTRADQLPSVTCIAQDRRAGKTNIWYYGTGEQIGNSAMASPIGNVGMYSGDGIFKSTDNGLSWEQLPATASHTPQTFTPLSSIWRIVTDPSHSEQDIVYAAAVGGIYRSTDGGTSWQLVLGTQTPNRMADATDIAITPDGVLYATLSRTSAGAMGSVEVYGVYRSADGVHWTNLQMPVTSSFGRVVLAIAPSNKQTVYFMAYNSNQSSLFKYTYLSGDGSGAGGKWENRTAAVPAFGGQFGRYNAQTGYDMALRVDPSNENIVYIGGTNIYRSTNGFSSSIGTTWIGGYNPDYVQSNPLGVGWRDMMYSNNHPDVHEILLLPSSPGVVLMATDGGIFKTLNAAATKVQWQSLNNGYWTTQFYAIAINQTRSGDRTVIGGMQDNSTFGSHDGALWKWLSGGDGSYCAIPDDNSLFYVSAQSGYLCRTKVNGTFDAVQLDQINPTIGFGFLFVAPFLLDPNNNSRMYMLSAFSVLSNSAINGAVAAGVQSSWSSLVSPPIKNDGTELLTALAISKQPADILYCGTNKAKIFRIPNAGSIAPTAEDISGSNFPSGAYIQCISVDPLDANHLIVVFSNYEIPSLFETEDGGQTWTNISGNLEENPDGSGAGPSCRWVEFVHHNSQTLYFVGTSTGLYSTTKLNGAQTQWTREGATSIGNMIVSMIRVRQSDGFVAVATHGGGVFTTNIVTDVEETETPATFFLEQNYPNPVRTSTTVRYSLPKSGHVSLKVYNALGEVIAMPVEGMIDAGYHSVDIQTGAWSDGRYFLHIEADGFAQTRLMTVTH